MSRFINPNEKYVAELTWIQNEKYVAVYKICVGYLFLFTYSVLFSSADVYMFRNLNSYTFCHSLYLILHVLERRKYN